jgi:Secretion system C-terminal sorting domain
MNRYPTIVALLLVGLQHVNAQLFVQDFSSSSTVNDYVNSSTPTNGQFTEAAASGAGSEVTISGGQLSLTRTSGNGCFLTRTVDFSPTPNLLKVVFDLSVPSVGTAQTSGAIMRFGTAYENGTDIPPNTNTNTRLGINLTSSGNFTLNNIANSATSASFSGQRTITWWINNTGAVANYLAPDGTTTSVGDDQSDVWVGNTLVFNNMGVATGTVNITDFKLNFFNGFATILLDNFSMTSEVPLPITLTEFWIERSQSHIALSFTTATELNNSHFDIERSNDGRNFTKIGEVKGAGNSQVLQQYSFTDETPRNGINYYRLKQVDFDGQFTYSAVRSVVFGKSNDVVITPQPVSDFLQVELVEALREDATWQIVDFAGRVVANGTVAAEAVRFNANMNTLPNGNYVLRVANNETTLVKQFQKK